MGDGARWWRRTSEKGGRRGDTERRGTWQSRGVSCGGGHSMSETGMEGERERPTSGLGRMRLMGGSARRGASAADSKRPGLAARASSRQ